MPDCEAVPQSLRNSRRTRSLSSGEATPLPPANLIRVVLVNTLEEHLATVSEVAVLNWLACGDALTTKVSTSRVSCALVSYRQEPRDTSVFGTTSDFDKFTLDGAALRGIVAAARTLKVTALWLDAWCYRSDGDEYDHADFCRTLNDVVQGVEAVVWLPRSKQGSPGEYPFRAPASLELAPGTPGT